MELDIEKKAIKGTPLLVGIIMHFHSFVRSVSEVKLKPQCFSKSSIFAELNPNFNQTFYCIQDKPILRQCHEKMKPLIIQTRLIIVYLR